LYNNILEKTNGMTFNPTIKLIYPSTAPEEILIQPLWLNSEIKIGGKPVLYQHWAKADVFFINDLLKNEGGFLSLEQFQDKYCIISIFFRI
jgi:hypothetical protein